MRGRGTLGLADAMNRGAEVDEGDSETESAGILKLRRICGDVSAVQPVLYHGY